VSFKLGHCENTADKWEYEARIAKRFGFEQQLELPIPLPEMKEAANWGGLTYLEQCGQAVLSAMRSLAQGIWWCVGAPTHRAVWCGLAVNLVERSSLGKDKPSWSDPIIVNQQLSEWIVPELSITIGGPLPKSKGIINPQTGWKGASTEFWAAQRTVAGWSAPGLSHAHLGVRDLF
jgi:hypothetical protein